MIFTILNLTTSNNIDVMRNNKRKSLNFKLALGSVLTSIFLDCILLLTISALAVLACNVTMSLPLKISASVFVATSGLLLSILLGYLSKKSLNK